MSKFWDYVVTVIAVGGGIVGLKVVVGVIASKMNNTVSNDVNKVFQAM